MMFYVDRCQLIVDSTNHQPATINYQPGINVC